MSSSVHFITRHTELKRNEVTNSTLSDTQILVRERQLRNFETYLAKFRV